MPRSGTTWLGQIFASSPDVRLKYCPLFSYEFKNILDENSSQEQWKNLFLAVWQTNSEFLDQEHLRKKGLIPNFEDKSEQPSHLVIKSNRFHHLVPYMLKLGMNVKFIHIVRHPCATLNSWMNNPSEFPENADPLKEWRTGRCRKMGIGEYWGFDDWVSISQQAIFLNEKYPGHHQIVSYEDLVRETEKETKRLFSFVGLLYSEQTQKFIELSHSRHDLHHHSVFKDPKQQQSWKYSLDPAIAKACIEEIKGTDLEQFLVI